MTIKYEEVLPKNKFAMMDFYNFYNGLYTKNFIENERESFTNFINYLNKSQNEIEWNYHIILAKNAHDIIIGGIIFNYFTKTNSIVIEFIVVENEYRCKHVATRLFNQSLKIGNIDARLNKKKHLDYVFCEVESTELSNNSMNHLYFWNARLMKRIMFEYIQPPLSKNLNAVYGLWFICRSMKNTNNDTLPTSLLISIIYDYMKYSMGIDDPTHNSEYISMNFQLSSVNEVELISVLK